MMLEFGSALRHPAPASHRERLIAMKSFLSTGVIATEPSDPRTVIVVEDGRIADRIHPSQVPADGNLVRHPGTIAGPGLIDIHCHGAAGSDFADGTVEDMSRAALYHRSHGTTSVLATVASCTPAQTEQALNAARALKASTPAILGVHLEGPYFSPHWPGCHLPSLLRTPSPAESATLAQYADVLRHITIAPELPGALELIRMLRDQNCVCAIGHSEASRAQIHEAMDVGLTHVTHIFNAMPRAARKGMVLEPGVLETALLDDLSVEAIGDAIHVGPALLELVYRVKGRRRMALVSDALRGVGAGLVTMPSDHATA